MNETPDTKSFRIEYRHLAFFFLGAVCICAVFFALGFVVGRAQTVETFSKEQDESKSSTVVTVGAPTKSTASKEEHPPETDLPGKDEEPKQGAVGVDYRKDLDFYTAVKEPKADQNFRPGSSKADTAARSGGKPPAAGSNRSSSTRAGSDRTGVVSLQVAALKSSSEADRLAKTLRSKGYPVFIVNPPKEDPGKLIRVQIGPYTSDADATKAKARLGSDGYTAITKR